MRLVKIPKTDLLEQAREEARNYNWDKNAILLERAAIELLNKHKELEAAHLYKKVGDAYNRAVHASNTRKEYFKNNDLSIRAYYKAEELFLKHNMKLLSQMSRVEALNGTILTESSSEKGKVELKEAIQICLDLGKMCSKNEDPEGFVNTQLLLLKSIAQILFLCREPSEFEKYLELGFTTVEKTWIPLQKIENIELRVEFLYWENRLYFSNAQTQIKYGDKKNEEKMKKIFFLRTKDTNEVVNTIEDFFILGRYYARLGMTYCLYGAQFVSNQAERLDFVEKGFEFTEKGLIFCRASRNNIDLIYCIYFLDYFLGIFNRFEYYQKRIAKDVHEFQNLHEIYKESHTFYGHLTSRISIMYYNNFAGRSFLKDDIRKVYAKRGIEIARAQLETLSYGPYIIINYQLLTQFYSYLVYIAREDDPLEEYIQKMFYYANLAENSAKSYKGGHTRSAGLASIYRANKTKADLVKIKEEKIQYLEVALEAQKSNVEYAFESDSVNLAAQIRLGLLYEEIGILKTEEKSLMDARELFLIIVDKATEKGYIHYSAACYEYIARLEDRLGNNLTSAEYYDKAQEAHSLSLQSVEFKPLKEKVNEKIQYAKAWGLIEKAKALHKSEQHLNAKKSYERATEILESLPNFNYEGMYYGAWIFLEEAEHLSKNERYEEAIRSYEKSREIFENSVISIRFIRKTLRKSSELKKLEKVAKIRMNHCAARINLDKARILGKKGDHLGAAEKFHQAAVQFRDICVLYKVKKEKDELEAIFHLCKAWESLEFAESYEDHEKFAEAANLFAKASGFFTQSKLKFLAQGNSNFSLALEEGCIFDQSHDLAIKKSLYPRIKSILRKAADFYNKGGFKNGADWALGTSVYFDAAWNLIQADEELNIKKKQELLTIGVKYLKSAAELFKEAGYKEKEKEALERIERVSKEEKILVSALNTINNPSISQSIEGIITPACPIESSQSPRIGELQQYSQEVSTFLESDRKVKKYKLVYKDLLQDNPEIQKSEFKIGIAQIGRSFNNDMVNDLFELKNSGLLGFKESLLDDLNEKINEMVKKAHNNGVDVLIFPEMMIDLNYSLIYEQLLKLTETYQMYIIPGSYHELSSKKNVCVVISPEGVLWKQEKHIPAIIHIDDVRFEEKIDVSAYPRETIVCNTKYGRIAIIICRDFLDMDLRVELKNFEPPVDIVINPAFTPVTADFKAAHFDARRSIYAYCFFANVAEFGDSLIYTPEKERIERTIPAKQEGLIYKDINLFRLRAERKKWEKEKEKELRFIQSTK